MSYLGVWGTVDWRAAGSGAVDWGAVDWGAVDWGDVPSWASAASSALALLLAAVAAFFAYRVYRSEARRSALTEQELRVQRVDRERAQADKIAAWPVSERETFQKLIERGVVGAAVRNASPLPVYDVEIVYRDDGAAWTATRYARIVTPSDEPHIFAGFDSEATIGEPLPERINADGSVKLLPSAEMQVAIRFTDARGRQWMRDDHGELHPDPDPGRVRATRPDATEPPDSANQSEPADRGDGTGRNSRGDRVGRGDGTGRDGRGDRNDRKDRGDRADRVGRSGRADAAVRGDRSDQGEVHVV